MYRVHLSEVQRFPEVNSQSDKKELLNLTYAAENKNSATLKRITLSNPTPQHPPDAPTACGTARGCSKCLPSLTSGAENSPKYLLVPMASISSMNTMEGACSSATLNSSRTSLGPSPRYFWMSSDPTTRRKVAEVWLATALASRVLPLSKEKKH